MYNKKNHTSVDNVSEKDRPREKMLADGVCVLNEKELLAVIIGKGTRKLSVYKMADLILECIEKHGTTNLFENLNKISGLGNTRILSIIASLEFSNRLLLPSKNKIQKPEDIIPWIKTYSTKKQEYFLVLSLNGANDIQAKRVVTIGLLNSSQVHPREVFSDCIKERAASIILAHNHPSGNVEPSREDIVVTKKLQKAGDILGIPVLDHIIFSENNTFSMLEQGLM